MCDYVKENGTAVGAEENEVEENEEEIEKRALKGGRIKRQTTGWIITSVSNLIMI